MGSSTDGSNWIPMAPTIVPEAVATVMFEAAALPGSAFVTKRCRRGPAEARGEGADPEMGDPEVGGIDDVNGSTGRVRHEQGGTGGIDGQSGRVDAGADD